MSDARAAARPLDPRLLVTTLAEHGVRYVLVGALAARLSGFPRVTADADIAPARDAENLTRLSAALRALDARVYTESVPEGLAFDASPAMLARADTWNLVTAAGRLDLLFSPAGIGGYDELAPRADHFEVFGVELLVARLEDILRSKEAADRPQDRQDVVVIRAMLARAVAATAVSEGLPMAAGASVAREPPDHEAPADERVIVE